MGHKPIAEIQFADYIFPAFASLGGFTVSVNVAQFGSYDGPPADFVLQVYFQQITASQQVRNALGLAGFSKATLPEKGKSASVSAAVRSEDLGYTVWDGVSGAHKFVVEPGQYTLFACRSSCDCPLNTTVTVP
eukprot:TRINITY_DN13807_c0_g2_i3.p1 TRINITY_DN13807_c0_g2~~TRINITY_DN13807_c0_g2_i3.p1  ORF type:complete len:146 (+),score=35.38 TRINITY_DN13807_c0_g2_i3:41-439(+)